MILSARSLERNQATPTEVNDNKKFQSYISHRAYMNIHVYKYMRFFPLWTPNISRILFSILFYASFRFSSYPFNRPIIRIILAFYNRTKRLHVLIKTEEKKEGIYAIFPCIQCIRQQFWLKMKHRYKSLSTTSVFQKSFLSNVSIIKGLIFEQ